MSGDRRGGGTGGGPRGGGSGGHGGPRNPGGTGGGPRGGGSRGHGGPRNPGGTGTGNGSGQRGSGSSASSGGARRGTGGGWGDTARGGGDRRRPQERRPARSEPRTAPPGRTDPARRAAFDVLRAVADSDAYANLVLPPMLAERGLTGRDAAFATELAYGTLRLRGRYDAILTMASTRPLKEIDPRVLDALRLGAHQLLGMRVPPHAAVGETVDLVRAVAGEGASSFANAVLRQIGRADLAEWERRMAERTADPLELLAQRTAHPAWIARAFREALAVESTAGGASPAELEKLLAADNAAPAVTLVARPGLVGADELAQEEHDGAIEPQGTVPTAWRLLGGAPDRIAAVRQGRMGVQDAGSQVVALALAAAPLTGRDEQWADVCAGPGGKAALLGAVLAERAEGAGRLVAGEVQPHRVGLLRRSVKAIEQAAPGLVEVVEWDGREVGQTHREQFDRVLVDAPCTGLGALRRRPEARWRRSPSDIPPLTALQRDLLTAALDATRVGGVVAYVTCSPHLAETRGVVDAVLRKRSDVEVVDAAAVLAEIAPGLTDVGAGPYAQLWPHRHGTDAMFLALLRRT
ncbi:RsmB/NOP family class I SAM-dependent RNA methyltransferase [Miniimonas arenae]|uniref:RsmB/NOP family class I SAM-dependent RNA methyltransferase n=1 Tax=Miniimonas arenae TaxID=676201 RepID=UPI001FE42131|nr:transcription antitermination factor NusB [Miniimonas arenae]